MGYRLFRDQNTVVLEQGTVVIELPIVDSYFTYNITASSYEIKTVLSRKTASIPRADIGTYSNELGVLYTEETLLSFLRLYCSLTDKIPAPEPAPTGSASSITLMKTGQQTSYSSGDDGDLQAGREVDHFTLNFSNIFDNTDRFTDTTGGQDYSNGIILDHSTYNSTSGTMLGYNKNVFSSDTWAGHLTTISASTHGGFSGWRMTNVREISNVYYHENVGVLNYEPFEITGFLFTSTTLKEDTTSALIAYNLNGTTWFFTKAGSIPAMACRDFTLSELGL